MGESLLSGSVGKSVPCTVEELQILSALKDWERKGYSLVLEEGSLAPLVKPADNLLPQPQKKPNRSKSNAGAGKKTSRASCRTCLAVVPQFFLEATFEHKYERPLSSQYLQILARKKLVDDRPLCGKCSFLVVVSNDTFKFKLEYYIDSDTFIDSHWPAARLLFADGHSGTLRVAYDSIEDERFDSLEIGFTVRAWTLTEKGQALLVETDSPLSDDEYDILRFLDNEVSPLKQAVIMSGVEFARNKIISLLRILETKELVHRPHGPRKGYVITTLGKGFMRQRLNEEASRSPE